MGGAKVDTSALWTVAPPIALLDGSRGKLLVAETAAMAFNGNCGCDFPCETCKHCGN